MGSLVVCRVRASAIDEAGSAQQLHQARPGALSDGGSQVRSLAGCVLADAQLDELVLV